MPESVIIVQRRGGNYVEGARVTLGFTFGVTDSKYTNSKGETVIQHSATGEAKIFVDGKEITKFNAPDRKLVFI